MGGDRTIDGHDMSSFYITSIPKVMNHSKLYTNTLSVRMNNCFATVSSDGIIRPVKTCWLDEKLLNDTET